VKWIVVDSEHRVSLDVVRVQRLGSAFCLNYENRHD
jgi:hypothetical protein